MPSFRALCSTVKFTNSEVNNETLAGFKNGNVPIAYDKIKTHLKYQGGALSKKIVPADGVSVAYLIRRTK